MSCPFLPPQRLIKKHARLYNVIGSGASQAIYATFMKLSQEANGGKKVGLIRGSGGRMGSFFYVMFRDIRMELVLKQLVAHPEIKKMKLPKRTLLAFPDIKDNAFWKDTYVFGVCSRGFRLYDKVCTNQPGRLI